MGMAAAHRPVRRAHDESPGRAEAEVVERDGRERTPIVAEALEFEDADRSVEKARRLTDR